MVGCQERVLFDWVGIGHYTWKSVPHWSCCAKNKRRGEWNNWPTTLYKGLMSRSCACIWTRKVHHYIRRPSGYYTYSCPVIIHGQSNPIVSINTRDNGMDGETLYRYRSWRQSRPFATLERVRNITMQQQVSVHWNPVHWTRKINLVYGLSVAVRSAVLCSIYYLVQQQQH